MKGAVTSAPVASLALACLVGAAGCWMSVPVLESSASPGLVPMVIAPESDAAIASAEPAAPFDEIDIDGPSRPVEASAELEVEATLVEARSAPHCGKSRFAVVMRYAVRRVIAGAYDERELYVAQECPELGLGSCRGGAGVRHFRAGDVHRLNLVQGTDGGSVLDKFAAGASGELPRYRARCGESVGAS
jgi:hypothetical protein